MESGSKNKTLRNSCLIAFALYSKIPVPQADWRDENMKYSMCFFPLVGVVIGAVLYGLICLEDGIGAHEALIVLTGVMVPILMTGGIHMDGFMDVSDALHSYQSKEDKLRIMDDPHVGSFAVMSAVCWFLAAACAWAAMPQEGWLLIAVSFVLSRSLSGYLVVTMPKAKDKGMNAQMSDASGKQISRRVLSAYIGICFAAALLIQPWLGVWMLIAAGLSVYFVRRMAKKQFGGLTGDVAGYFLQVCELAMLLGICFAEAFGGWIGWF